MAEILAETEPKQFWFVHWPHLFCDVSPVAVAVLLHGVEQLHVLPGRPLRAEDGELGAVDDGVGVGGGVAAQLEVAGVAVRAEVQRRLAHRAADAHRVRREDDLEEDWETMNAEHMELLDAVEQYGYGNWGDIAKKVTSSQRASVRSAGPSRREG